MQKPKVLRGGASAIQKSQGYKHDGLREEQGVHGFASTKREPEATWPGQTISPAAISTWITTTSK